MNALTPCLAAALLAISSCAPSPPAAQRGKVPASVLFVGNSYSFEVPAEFRRRAARSGTVVRVGQVTHGGWSLDRHAANPETLHAIRSGEWDVVVLQEQSRIPSQPAARSRYMAPSVRKLAAEARSAGAMPVLYQTWGYREGDPSVSGDSFQAMNRRVRDGYQATARDAGGLAIVPVGDAWEKEAAAGRHLQLYQPDGSHPSRAGVRLAAETFRRSLLAPSNDEGVDSSGFAARFRVAQPANPTYPGRGPKPVFP